MTTAVQSNGGGRGQVSWCLLASSIFTVGCTAQPRPVRPQGNRVNGSKGQRASVLDPGCGFLTVSLGPFGRGHPRLTWVSIYHASLCDLGHPLLSLMWGKGQLRLLLGHGHLSLEAHTSLDCRHGSGAVAAHGETWAALTHRPSRQRRGS